MKHYLLLLLLFSVRVQQSYAQCTAINGIVFQDFNQNGVQDTNEPFVPNIIVTAYDDNNNAYPNNGTTTDTNGAYTIITDSSNPNQKFRVEFT
jgi:hypothetical protein